MAHASLHTQRIEWMWESNINPWSQSKSAKWRSYSDVETAIIEEAYTGKLPEALLDDYHIDFEQCVQTSNNNVNDRRPVKRMVNERVDARLREERFMPNPIVPSASFTHSDSRLFIYSTLIHFNLPLIGPLDDTNLRMMVANAAEGLIVEGKKVGKQKEGEWMARQLLNVKEETAKEMKECCARLYCMESFLYKKLNEVMRLEGDREYETVWKSKVPTFGPFACLLDQPLGDFFRIRKLTVYRGANLSDDLIEQYRQKICVVFNDGRLAQFPTFISTSRNQAKAERFGNVLFLIEIDGWQDGHDVSPYSDYEEEEHLLHPNVGFRIRSCTFDQIKNKWIIHLQTWRANHNDMMT